MDWYEFAIKVGPAAALVIFAFWAGWKGLSNPPKD